MIFIFVLGLWRVFRLRRGDSAHVEARDGASEPLYGRPLLRRECEPVTGGFVDAANNATGGDGTVERRRGPFCEEWREEGNAVLGDVAGECQSPC